MKRSKYRAVRTPVVDPKTGKTITFASKAEAKRFLELRLLERAEEINRLELQPEYPCVVEGEHICTYRADFRYFDKGNRRVVEDVKGVRTPEYRLKKALVEALYRGTKIVEVKA